MVAVLRRCIAALRQPQRARRIAHWLWIAWAVIVWNVVFDHVIVVAGREYLAAAGAAATAGGPYVRMNEWMQPAIARGLWIASVAAGGILLIGLVGVRLATRASNPPASDDNPLQPADPDGGPYEQVFQ